MRASLLWVALFAFIYIKKRINMSYTSTHTGEQIDDAIDAVISKESTWDAKADIADINSAINALDKSDSAVAGKYVSSVSESNGVITVTREDLPQGGSSTWGDITGDIADQTDLKSALDAKATPADITAAINGLNKSGSPTTNSYVSTVRQSAGIIEVQKATLPMHTAGNGISVSSGTVSAKLGSGLSFDANGAIQATGGGGDVPAWVGNVTSATVQGKLTTNLPDILQYHLTGVSAVDEDGCISSWDNTAKRLSSIVVTNGEDDLITRSGFDSWVTTLGGVQKKLTAGTNITIAADGTISATGGGGSVAWGSITGTLASQTDLKSALDGKAGIGDIPTKVSDLTNDSGFQTSAQVSTAITNAVNGLDATSVGGAGKYIQSISETNGVISATEATMPSVPTKVSDLTNDSGFQTSAQVSSAVSSNNTTLGVSTSAYPVTGGSSKLKIVKVASLPATRDANTIYLVEE